jgi:hypothetical protein
VRNLINSSYDLKKTDFVYSTSCPIDLTTSTTSLPSHDLSSPSPTLEPNDVEAPTPMRTKDVEGGEHLTEAPLTHMQTEPVKGGKRVTECDGLVIELEKGVNPYLRYPFALHGERRLPWTVTHLTPGMLVVQAWACANVCVKGQKECQLCRDLLEAGEGYLPGIVERMNNCVHENTPLVFHGTAGLIETV